MMRSRPAFIPAITTLATLAFASSPARACAVCFGDPSDPLSAGLFWGVMALLGVVLGVLTGFVAFFVHVARRSRAVAAADAAAAAASASSSKHHVETPQFENAGV